MSIFDLPVNQAGLRKCQKLAYEAIKKHYSKSGAERGIIVQLPTGTGKSGLIAITPFGVAKNTVLILTPNLKLAKDMADDLDIIKFPDENSYKKFGILTDKQLASAELYVLRLESGASAADIEEHHLIVSNYHQLNDVEKWFSGKADAVDLIIIDEAHHQAADTYQSIIDFFPNAKVVGLTATPFRSDGKKVEGKFVYKYTFNEAIRDKVIRNLKVVNVASEQIELKFTDKEKTVYDLKEVLKMKEQSWFSRGIALSQDCCDSIARKAKEKLDELRASHPEEQHQIIASAISKRHARENVKPAFEKLGLKVGLVSSAEEDKKTNDETFNKLRQGKIDVIVNIGMLGEGFNHPPLGVAAIFRPYKSLNPYIQFVGRVIRKHGTTPHSYVVSHVGLNQLQRFEEFKMFDADDQEFLRKHLVQPVTDGSGEESSFIDPNDIEGGKETGPQLEVHELGDQVIDLEAQFVNEQLIDDVVGKVQSMSEEERKALLIRLGVDPNQVQLSVTTKDTRLKPVEKRKASRNLLNEKEKSITTDIINTLGLGMFKRDFNPMSANFPWVKKQVSRNINKKLGIGKDARKSITNSMFEKMEKDGVIEEIRLESLAYFKDKLKKKGK